MIRRCLKVRVRSAGFDEDESSWTMAQHRTRMSFLFYFYFWQKVKKRHYNGLMVSSLILSFGKSNTSTRIELIDVKESSSSPAAVVESPRQHCAALLCLRRHYCWCALIPHRSHPRQHCAQGRQRGKDCGE